MTSSLLFAHDPSGRPEGMPFAKTGDHFSGSCAGGRTLVVEIDRVELGQRAQPVLIQSYDDTPNYDQG